MGSGPCAYLRLGIAVHYSDFWKVVGHTRACENGHVAKDDSGYCGRCGKPYKRSETICATKAFAEWSRSNDKEPNDLYQELIDNGNLCSSDPMLDGSNSDLILCVTLRQQSDNFRMGTGPVLDSELTLARIELFEKATLLGVQDRPIGLYSQLDWS